MGFATNPRARRRWQRLRYYLRRRVAIVALGGACAHCGTRACEYSTAPNMHLDHREPATKRRRARRVYGVLGPLRDYNRASLWEEIDKCQLLCAECHEEKTALDVQRQALPQEEVPF